MLCLHSRLLTTVIWWGFWEVLLTCSGTRGWERTEPWLGVQVYLAMLQRRYRENSSLGQPWTVAVRPSLFKVPVQMTALGSEEKGVWVMRGDWEECQWSSNQTFYDQASTVIHFIFFNLFYWSTVDLQCCVIFCTAQWFGFTYISILFHILFHHGLSQDIVSCAVQ